MSTGILIPKLCYRFMINFLEPTLMSDISENQLLCNQIIGINSVQSLPPPEGSHTELFFEDDTSDDLNKTIRSLYSQSKKFAVKIEYLDGNSTVIRTNIIKDAKIVGIEYGAMSYAESAACIIAATIHYKSVIVS